MSVLGPLPMSGSVGLGGGAQSACLISSWGWGRPDAGLGATLWDLLLKFISMDSFTQRHKSKQL